MRIKRIIAVLIIAVMAISLASCDTNTTSASVYWLNFKPELDETLQALAKRYQDEKGVTVKVVTPDSGTYKETLKSELEGDDPPTMFVLGNQQEAKEYEEYTLDLKGTALEMALTPETYCLTNEDGKISAMPYCTECFGIVVNPELIELLGYYSVEDITSFDKLKEIAEIIHDNESWLGYDAFCSHDLDADDSWRLTAHLANLEYYYEEKDYGTWSECPASLTGNYMENYRNLYDLCLNNSISTPEELALGGHDPVQEFKNGEAAFLLTGSWDYANITESIPDAEIIPYYCGVEGEEKAGLNSGSENYWAVNATVSEEDQKATVAFMKWLISDEEASAALVKELGNIPYEGSAKSDNGFLAKNDKYRENGNYTMKWAMVYQPNSDDYRAKLVEALKAYNIDQSDKNWGEVRTAFVNNWADQYAAVYDN